MLTLISTIVGFLASGLPSILNFFTTRQNNNYQLEIIKLQMEAAREGHQLEIDKMNTEADIKLQQTLYSYDNAPSGSKFVDGLRSSVRPVITYSFFGMWITVEFVTFFWAIHVGHSINAIIPMVWGETNQAIFATIIAFWFGSRNMIQQAIFPNMNQPQAKIKK